MAGKFLQARLVSGFSFSTGSRKITLTLPRGRARKISCAASRASPPLWPGPASTSTRGSRGNGRHGGKVAQHCRADACAGAMHGGPRLLYSLQQLFLPRDGFGVSENGIAGNEEDRIKCNNYGMIPEKPSSYFINNTTAWPRLVVWLREISTSVAPRSASSWPGLIEHSDGGAMFIMPYRKSFPAETAGDAGAESFRRRFLGGETGGEEGCGSRCFWQ